MSVNLNEFTAEQLVFALQLFNEKVDDCNYEIQRCKDLPAGDLKDDLERSYSNEFDTAILWKVQISNALEEVQRREKTFAR